MLKKILLSCLIVMASVFAVSLVADAGVFAYDPVVEGCRRGGGNSVYCSSGSSTNPLTGQDGLILKVANIIAIVAGAAAVIIIVLAGLRYVTSGGSAEDISGAKRTIIYAIVGLLVIAMSRFILGLIMSAL